MPRSLAATLQRFVPSFARARGERYFLGNRVEVLQETPTSVLANVRGTGVYEVALSLRGERVLATCSCPYFQDREDVCKHVWATILAADRAGVFQVSPGAWLDPAFESLDEDGDFDELLSAAADDASTGSGRLPSRAPAPPWQTFLSTITAPLPEAHAPPLRPLPGQILYVFDLARSTAAGGIVIELMGRDRKRSGDWGKPRGLTLTRRELALLPLEEDRRAIEAICGADPAYGYSATYDGYYGGSPIPSVVVVRGTLQRDLVPRLCDTGRLAMRDAPDPANPGPEPPLFLVHWDPERVSFQVRIAGNRDTGYTISGVLRSDHAEHALKEALFVGGDLVLWPPQQAGGPFRFAPFDAGDANLWLARLWQMGDVVVPASESSTLAEALAASKVPCIDCPDDLRMDVRSGPPRPTIRITRPQGSGRRDSYPARLQVAVSFAYGDCEVEAASPRPVVVNREARVVWRRDREAEAAAQARLQALGVTLVRDWQTQKTRLELAHSAMAPVVARLVHEGWRVEADGRAYRRPGAMTLDVRSGIDWFELHGGVDFDGLRADLPSLLAAARRGEQFVALGDGTYGMLPEEWLARAGRFAAFGAAEDDHLRFAPAHAALLDAWLETQPQVSVDEAFARARAEIARFEGVAEIDAPPTFGGQLRSYQREALGWFDFLRRFGFGGCLADEMGLGKTVMVLAAMEARRLDRARERGPHRASLIVVPRSLVFNWHQEAARFAPGLRVLDFTGPSRRDALERIGEYDLVLTTYGTLRRDIGHLKDVRFDYAILDEAQAIKNARTSAAKAARLLAADHRLALSGTPVENHLGELWSLFDFLNPGIAGTGSIAGIAGTTRTADDETLTVLARGLRPFILRRTKEQVARELPARTEQTLYCDLEGPQRKLYDELRDHYRASLLGKVGRTGLGSAKLQILEALLRLRQAACHPGLIDPARAAEPAAKLDILLPRLQELAEDGRKVLVFSQFTTLLGLLRTRLDEAKLAYEYLDGKTRDRQARVERFQSTACPLFLISLKAGGLGLNLTAAEYVFLLDPWWNPAVEAQAIDRAHRIGQTQPVFAFRLIARETVEEKVLELQASKRRLADAIVRADESLIRDLRREDLELLLS